MLLKPEYLLEMNDIILNKKESIERCVKNARIYYSISSEVPFEKDYFKQDAIAINIQRACEQSIDLANYIIKKKKLGLPKASRESFSILVENNIIDSVLSSNLQRMVSFRNILIHEYKKLDITLMKDVIENHLNNLIEFTNIILRKFS